MVRKYLFEDYQDYYHIQDMMRLLKQVGGVQNIKLFA